MKVSAARQAEAFVRGYVEVQTAYPEQVRKQGTAPVDPSFNFIAESSVKAPEPQLVSLCRPAA